MQECLSKCPCRYIRARLRRYCLRLAGWQELPQTLFQNAAISVPAINNKGRILPLTIDSTGFFLLGLRATYFVACRSARSILYHHFTSSCDSHVPAECETFTGDTLCSALTPPIILGWPSIFVLGTGNISFHSRGLVPLSTSKWRSSSARSTATSAAPAQRMQRDQASPSSNAPHAKRITSLTLEGT